MSSSSNTYFAIHCFTVSTHDAADVATEAIVADTLSLQRVLGHELFNLLDSLLDESVLVHVEEHDSVVGQQTSLEGGGVAFVNLVGRDVQFLDKDVVADILRKTLTEHIAEEIGSQVQRLQVGLFHTQVNAHFLAGFVVEAVQLQVEVDERLIDFEGLAEVARAFVIDAVVAQVQVSQDLGLEEVLGDLASA